VVEPQEKRGKGVFKSEAGSDTVRCACACGGRTDIAKLRTKLGLDRVIGCSEIEYSPWAPIDSATSLWHLFISRVAPAELPLPKQKHLVFVGSTVPALSAHTTSTRHTLALVTH
jgi:hypothetical protein